MELLMPYIYLVTNLVNNKYYVGRTFRSVSIRWKEHLDGFGGSTLLDKAIKKYGVESFSLQVLAESGCVDELEKIWILLLQSNNREIGYNIVLGGNGFHPGTAHPFAGRVGPNKGRKFSDEFREKQRQSHLGKKESEETKLKKSLAHQVQAERQRGKPNLAAREWMLRNNPMKKKQVPGAL